MPGYLWDNFEDFDDFQEDEMNTIYNRVIWGIGDGKTTPIGQIDICYSKIFGPWSVLKQKLPENPIFYSWFRLAKKSIPIEVATEYLNNVVFSIIPDRMKPGIKFVPLSKERLCEIGADRPDEIPWLELQCDTRIVSMDDLFVLLNLLRFPQEVPTCIVEMNKIRNINVHADAALFISLACNHLNLNHSFVGIGSLEMIITGIALGCLKKWKMGEEWIRLVPNAPPIKKSTNKTISLEKIFLLPLQGQEKRGEKMMQEFLLEVGYNAKT